ncbi:hypothetical protein DFS33DRAFT_1482926 [Desarmillaria ectypa]|nr:hypothetical protein DFS33DRAFT_1482926 [Desarmillaria ectypa]
MPPRKRGKIGSSKNDGQDKRIVGNRSSRGGLTQLADMPVDIWFEIFGWLEPIDLLQLARSTKDIRKVLISRSSASGWKAARSNIPGLPEPAPGMSEPAWANLIFTLRCHKPYIGEPMCYQGDVARVAQRYISFNDDEKKKYRAGRRQLVLDHMAHVERSVKWLFAYEKDREKEQRQVRSGRLYSILERLGELGYLTEFEQMGDDQMYAFIKHRLVCQNRLLTERIWLNIKYDIIAYMEDIRMARLEREHDQVILPRKNLLVKAIRDYTTSASRYPYNEVLPGLADFYSFKSIKEILDRPADVVVDTDTFSSLVPSLPTLCDQWRSSLDDQLLAHFPDRDGIDSPKHLSLAQNVLYCSICNTSQFYPQVLAHRCLTESTIQKNKSDDSAKLDPTLVINIPFSSYRARYRKPWNAEGLLLNEQLTKIVKDIIRVLGLDPDTTTAADLDGLRTYFRCLTPPSMNFKGIVVTDDEDNAFRLFGWRKYVNHLLRMKDRYESLELDTHVKLVPLEATKSPECIVLSTEQDTKHWICLHCRDTSEEKKPDTRLHAKVHVQKVHNIEAPEVNKDYYRQFAVPPLLPRSIVKITTELA